MSRSHVTGPASPERLVHRITKTLLDGGAVAFSGLTLRYLRLGETIEDAGNTLTIMEPGIYQRAPAYNGNDMSQPAPESWSYLGHITDADALLLPSARSMSIRERDELYVSLAFDAAMKTIPKPAAAWRRVRSGSVITRH